MPIQNLDDAVEVETQIAAIFAATADGRTSAIRRLFVETLDFNGASGQVSLAGASAPSTSSGQALPDAAERIAVLDGVQVVYIPLNIEGTDRVRKAEVDAAARLIADQLGDDLLLVFTNTSASQLRHILPEFEGARPTLRRMVVERDLPRRTAVQQGRASTGTIKTNTSSAPRWTRPSTSSRSPGTSSPSTSAFSRTLWGLSAGSATGRKRASGPSCRRCSTV